MTKKRKATLQIKLGKDNQRRSILGINTHHDDTESEDEFHIKHDKILLDETPDAKRRRRWKEEDTILEPSDEEVLNYEEESDENEAGHESTNEKDSDPGYSGPGALTSEDDEEESEAWGASKEDYYGADAIATEEHALEEEREAMQMQKRELERMTEADFGIDESLWLNAGDDDGAAEADGHVVTEILPPLQITDAMGPSERLKLLKTRYPEFEPLSKELLELQALHNGLALAATAAQEMHRRRTAKATDQGTILKTSTTVMKFRAMTAYLAALTMYFALLTCTCTNADGESVALAPAKLRDHPIMESLVQCRAMWERVKNVSIADRIVDEDTSNELEAIEEELDGHDQPVDGKVEVSLITADTAKAPPKTKMMTKAQRATEAAKAAAEAKRTELLRKTEEELAALSSLTDKDSLRRAAKAKRPKRSSVTTFANDADSDFGDEIELNRYEVGEKLRKRKSLRFYTSQIAQKQSKRSAAEKDIGADHDIPYRERLRDRWLRLNAEAERRARKPLAPMQELGGDSGDNDRQRSQEVKGEASNEDEGYYELIAARSKQKQADKAKAAAARAQAARDCRQVIAVDKVGPDGKRTIGYTIAKNKGLTPHRKKDARNPRVKKKKKYEEKMKKLSSMRQIYKGGEGRGGYKGELTGIKKDLVKSVKL